MSFSVACGLRKHEECDGYSCLCACHPYKELERERKNKFKFTIEELKTLYNLIEHEYIPYENEVAHAVINKIGKIIKENE